MQRTSSVLLVSVVLLLPGCAARSRPSPPAPGSPAVLQVREGLASYYGPGFHGRRTASGARFDMKAMVAAHPAYPFGTIVRVTNLRNRRSVEVRILDRGPAAGPRADGVVIDVSLGAAEKLGFVRSGRAPVRLEVLRWGLNNSNPKSQIPNPKVPIPSSKSQMENPDPNRND